MCFNFTTFFKVERADSLLPRKSSKVDSLLLLWNNLPRDISRTVVLLNRRPEGESCN